MKQFFLYFLIFIGIIYFIIYPKYKKIRAIEEVKEVLNAHNMNSCVEIKPIKINEVVYNSGRKNDTGDEIYFTCIDKYNRIIHGKVQYHDNYYNKNSYVEINF